MGDPWQRLRALTQARIGLKRSGHAVATDALLEFQRAHAAARDAVHKKWDVSEFAARLKMPSLTIASHVDTREEFLRRPDLGRKLKTEIRADVPDLVFIFSDGLSAKAIDQHALGLWQALTPHLRAFKYSIVLAPFSRVAISDEIGTALKAKIAIMIIGERPGLSSADSLGLYLTYNPQIGNHDANRNCISNIRPPDGLTYQIAVTKLMYLINESLRLQLSGVQLKDGTSELSAATRNLPDI